MNKLYDAINEKEKKEMNNFLNDIEEVCKKYNLSISHQDQHGAFIIERFDKSNIDWLKAATKGY